MTSLLTILTLFIKFISVKVLEGVIMWLVTKLMDKISTQKLQKNTMHLLEDTIEKTINTDGSKVEKRTRKYKP